MDKALDLRQALGLFTTGVTIITIKQSECVYGMTVNSFTSVSLLPPLVLWCLAHDEVHQGSFALFSKAEDFCVSILSETQTQLSRETAQHDKHQMARDHLLPNSLLIKDCLVGFHCSVYDRIDRGDHLIIFGRVNAAERINKEGRPLLFHQSDYCQLK